MNVRVSPVLLIAISVFFSSCATVGEVPIQIDNPNAARQRPADTVEESAQGAAPPETESVTEGVTGGVRAEAASPAGDSRPPASQPATQAPQAQAPGGNLPTPSPSEPAPPRQVSETDVRGAVGLAEEVRSLTETGILSSMLQAVELIRARNLGSTDFGRVMNGINAILIQRIYPDSNIRLPAVDMPITHTYTRIIREAERGNFVVPLQGATDFLEYILPFLSYYYGISGERLIAALPSLDTAARLRPNSVLPSYFKALAYEKSGRLREAESAFNQAYRLSGEFYPALIGVARVRAMSGETNEAAAILTDLLIRYPDNIGVKRQLAIIWFSARNWSRAGPLVDEVLQRDSRDSEFLLMRAAIYVEQGQFSQAQASLDTFASLFPNSRLYLFLRARVQSEGFRNRDSAINYLRSILRTNPDDNEVLVYTARLLMESQRPADQEEGRELLRRLQATSSSIAVMALGLRDAITRESWAEAQGYLNRILESRRTEQDLNDAYTIERNLGNNTKAFSYARELYDMNPSGDENIAVYISALIDMGRRDEASRMIETRLASTTGQAKSRYYYLRSRIQANEDNALADLRSSLFEDPRNLQTLIAMFEIYNRRREERRAVNYLRQALAIAPDNPRLKRYEQEYASLLRNP